MTLQYVAGKFRRYARGTRCRKPEVGPKDHRRCAQKVFRSDADHRTRLPVDAQRLADYPRVGAKMVLPEPVADYDRRRLAGSLRLSLKLSLKPAAHGRTHPKRAEVRGCNQ